MNYNLFHYHLQVACLQHILFSSLFILVIVFSSTRMICSCGTGRMCWNKLIHWNSNLPWMTGYMGLFNLQSIIFSLKDTAFSCLYGMVLLCFASHYFSVCLTYSSSKFFNDLNKLHVSFEDTILQLKLIVMIAASLYGAAALCWQYAMQTQLGSTNKCSSELFHSISSIW